MVVKLAMNVQRWRGTVYILNPEAVRDASCEVIEHTHPPQARLLLPRYGAIVYLLGKTGRDLIGRLEEEGKKLPLSSPFHSSIL